MTSSTQTQHAWRPIHAGLERILSDIDAGKDPVLWRNKDKKWDPVELGPGIISVLAGAPGMGKTTLALQLTCDALRHNPGLYTYVASCEMTEDALLRRLLARYSGVSAEHIRFPSKLTEADKGRINIGKSVLIEIAPRFYIYDGVFALKQLTETLKQGKFPPGLLVIDYVQALSFEERAAENKRQEINEILKRLRELADKGVGIIAVASVSRQKSAQGSTYESGLNLASFKESGDVEYSADSCWILSAPPKLKPDKKAQEEEKRSSGLDGLMVLKCEKNRHGPAQSLPLSFDKKTMCFEVLGKD